MRPEDMNAAREMGFLDGKLGNPITIKFGDLLEEAITNMSLAEEITKADFIRDAVIEKILAEKQRFDRMQKVFGKAKKTTDDLGIQGNPH